MVQGPMGRSVDGATLLLVLEFGFFDTVSYDIKRVKGIG